MSESWIEETPKELFFKMYKDNKGTTSPKMLLRRHQAIEQAKLIWSTNSPKVLFKIFFGKNNWRGCFPLSFSIKANQPVFSGSWVKALLRRILRILEFQYYDPAFPSSWTPLPHRVWSGHQTQPIKLIWPQCFVTAPVHFYLSTPFLMPHWPSLDWSCAHVLVDIWGFLHLLD